MKEVRIGNLRVQDHVHIDVVCDCGANGLPEAGIGNPSFNHAIRPSDKEDSKYLHCKNCNILFELRPQGGHIHIVDLGEPF